MTKPTPALTAPMRFHRLRFLSVVGGFLDGQIFDFAIGLNCLIDIRGTGKTTVLELVRYALDMLPSHGSDPAERRRIELLVKRNLGGGRVQLGIETRDGLVYVVNRSRSTIGVWKKARFIFQPPRTPTRTAWKFRRRSWRCCSGGSIRLA